jgi:hypothetical protein
MAYAAYIAPNLISSTATISSGTADSTYGLAKLYDGKAGVPFRWTVTTGGYVEVDFGAAVSVGAVALINHNLTAGASVTLKGGASANPSTVNVSLTWREHDLWAAVTPAASYRYWRLTVSETNTANSEIGELVLGALTQLTSGYTYGFQTSVNRGMASHETELGVRYAAKRWERLGWSYQWRGISTAQLAELQALDAAVDGSRLPFVWVPESSAAPCYYVRKQDGLAHAATSYARHDCSLELSEEHRGSTITR